MQAVVEQGVGERALLVPAQSPHALFQAVSAQLRVSRGRQAESEVRGRTETYVPPCSLELISLTL